MKKLFLFLTFMFVATIVLADTYNLVPGTVIKAVTTRTANGYQSVVSVTPQQGIVTLQQYYAGRYDGQWMDDVPMASGSVIVNPVKGDRFQLLQSPNLFANITYEMMASNFVGITLDGVKIDCGHPKGCALQIFNPYK